MATNILASLMGAADPSDVMQLAASKRGEKKDHQLDAYKTILTKLGESTDPNSIIGIKQLMNDPNAMSYFPNVLPSLYAMKGGDETYQQVQEQRANGGLPPAVTGILQLLTGQTPQTSTQSRTPAILSSPQTTPQFAETTIPSPTGTNHTRIEPLQTQQTQIPQTGQVTVNGQPTQTSPGQIILPEGVRADFQLDASGTYKGASLSFSSPTPSEFRKTLKSIEDAVGMGIISPEEEKNALAFAKKKYTGDSVKDTMTLFDARSGITTIFNKLENGEIVAKAEMQTDYPGDVKQQQAIVQKQSGVTTTITPEGATAVTTYQPGQTPQTTTGTTKVALTKKEEEAAKALSPEQAGKSALIQSGIDSLDKVKKKLFAGGNVDSGNISRIDVANINLATPMSKGRDIRRAYDEAIQAKFRAETGAAAPEKEIQAMNDRFLPSTLDSDELIRDKFNRLQAFLKNAKIKALPGGTGNTLYQYENMEGMPSSNKNQDLNKSSDDELKKLIKKVPAGGQ